MEYNLVGRFCVVRCRNAGVHAGTVQSIGKLLVLLDSRRLWQFYSNFTLSELAMTGLAAEKSRIAVVLPELYINFDDVAEIIPATLEAQKTIMDAPNG